MSTKRKPIPARGDWCSFCGHHQTEVGMLVATYSSFGRVTICDDCVRVAAEICREPPPPPKDPPRWTPEIIHPKKGKAK
jgi:ATP-dependent protease Clp ATPase subunit